MKNYIMFWHMSTDDRKDDELIAVHANNDLKQLYLIPRAENEQNANVADFELLEYISEPQLLDELDQKVANGLEWRLLVFCLYDVSPVDTKLDELQQILSHMMSYESNRPAGKLPKATTAQLHCELPQQIWVITLRDELLNNFQPEAKTAKNRIEWADELPYKVYPPNCRFFRYSIDYRQKTSFGIALFRMHCAIRTLAENKLLSDELKGNRAYKISAVLDTGRLCAELDAYWLWLEKVRNALREMRIFEESAIFAIGNVNEGYIPDYPNHFSLKRVEIKDRAIVTEREIERENREERKCLQASRKSFSREIECQKGAVLQESDRKDQQLLREELERSMIAKETICKPRIFQTAVSLRRWLMLSDDVTRKKEDSDTEFEHFRKMKDTISMGSAVKLSLCIIIFNFLFWGAMRPENMNEAMPFVVKPLIIMAEGMTCIVGYFLIKGIYSNVCNSVDSYNRRLNEGKVKNSRSYYKNVVSYLKATMILEHDEGMGERGNQRVGWLRSKQQELDYYYEFCKKLRELGFQRIEGAQHTVEKKGNPGVLLRQGRSRALYALPGEGRILHLNGNGQLCKAPFSFVQEICLNRLYRIKGIDTE